MTWIQTASGIAFDLLSPKPEDVRIADIAHALARIPRFTGHARPGLHCSVAEHSARVCQMALQVDPRAAWPALMHDAHEAYVGDVSSPLKRAMRADSEKRAFREGEESTFWSDFDTVEVRILDAVNSALNCTVPMKRFGALVHALDMLDLSAEIKAALGMDRNVCAELAVDFLLLETSPIEGLSINAAQARFLSLAVAHAPTSELRDEAESALVALVSRVTPNPAPLCL